MSQQPLKIKEYSRNDPTVLALLNSATSKKPSALLQQIQIFCQRTYGDDGSYQQVIDSYLKIGYSSGIGYYTVTDEKAGMNPLRVESSTDLNQIFGKIIDKLIRDKSIKYCEDNEKDLQARWKKEYGDIPYQPPVYIHEQIVNSLKKYYGEKPVPPGVLSGYRQMLLYALGYSAQNCISCSDWKRPFFDKLGTMENLAPITFIDYMGIDIRNDLDLRKQWQFLYYPVKDMNDIVLIFRDGEIKHNSCSQAAKFPITKEGSKQKGVLQTGLFACYNNKLSGYITLFGAKYNGGAFDTKGPIEFIPIYLVISPECDAIKPIYIPDPTEWGELFGKSTKNIYSADAAPCYHTPLRIDISMLKAVGISSKNIREEFIKWLKNHYPRPQLPMFERIWRFLTPLNSLKYGYGEYLNSPGKQEEFVNDEINAYIASLLEYMQTYDIKLPIVDLDNGNNVLEYPHKHPIIGGACIKGKIPGIITGNDKK